MGAGGAAAVCRRARVCCVMMEDVLSSNFVVIRLSFLSSRFVRGCVGWDGPLRPPAPPVSSGAQDVCVARSRLRDRRGTFSLQKGRSGRRRGTSVPGGCPAHFYPQ